HQPGTSFHSIEFQPQRSGGIFAVFPQLWLHKSSSGSGGRGTHGYMGHKNNICSQEPWSAHILDDIVIIANQNARFPSQQIENTVSVAGGKIRINEGV